MFRHCWTSQQWHPRTTELRTHHPLSVIRLMTSDNSPVAETTAPPEPVEASPTEEPSAEVRPRPVRPYRRRVFLPAILFVATCGSTFWVGTTNWLQIFSDPAYSSAGILDLWRQGLIYMVAVMGILLAHFLDKSGVTPGVIVDHEVMRALVLYKWPFNIRELERTVDHIRGFCDEPRRWPKGELNFPRAFYTAKAFPEDEVVVATSAATSGNHLILTKLIAETRGGARGQIEAILPFGFLEKPGGAWTGGIGDAVLATKWALLHSLRTGSILSAGVELIMPTGRDDRGLGKDTWIFEPFIAYGQALPADAFIQVHLGSELSTDPNKTGHEVFWRLATGMSFFENNPFGRAWTPMVEVLGAMDIEDGATPNWDVVPQIQIPLPVRQHIRLSLGARIPIDHFDTRPIVAVMYLLWDFYDGGLAEGWVGR